jgi:hypothetical protein
MTPTPAAPKLSAPTSIKDKNKRETENVTVYIIVFLGLVYGYFFLPGAVLNIFKLKFGEISQAANVGSILAGMTFSAMVAYVLGRLIMAQDILATTDLKAARFFRAQFPSEAIKKKYEKCNCTKVEANNLWFPIFNPWREDSHPQHLAYGFTFQRDYSCRFVFHAQLSFVFFTVLGIVTSLASILYVKLEPDLTLELIYSRALLLFIAVIIVSLLFFWNRLGKNCFANPRSVKGCWARFVEINDMNKDWLEDAVFKQAPTYDDARKLIRDDGWLIKYGYKQDKTEPTLKEALQNKLKERVDALSPDDVTALLKDVAKDIVKEPPKS